MYKIYITYSILLYSYMAILKLYNLFEINMISSILKEEIDHYF